MTNHYINNFFPHIDEFQNHGNVKSGVYVRLHKQLALVTIQFQIMTTFSRQHWTKKIVCSRRCIMAKT